jgi:hypothetical protein
MIDTPHVSLANGRLCCVRDGFNGRGVVVGSNRSMAAYLDEIGDYTPALDVSEWPAPCGASASPPQPFNSVSVIEPLDVTLLFANSLSTPR